MIKCAPIEGTKRQRVIQPKLPQAPPINIRFLDNYIRKDKYPEYSPKIYWNTRECTAQVMPHYYARDGNEKNIEYWNMLFIRSTYKGLDGKSYTNEIRIPHYEIEHFVRAVEELRDYTRNAQCPNPSTVAHICPLPPAKMVLMEQKRCCCNALQCQKQTEMAEAPPALMPTAYNFYPNNT